jgi:hypothetical protein
MDYPRALISAADGKAVLFVGAGFSLGATSLNGGDFPTGPRLARVLCDNAQLPQTEDLKNASSWYLKKKRPDELITLLKETFSVRAVQTKHHIVATVPWKAIYTTNYDDVLELAAKAHGKKLTPATLSDFPSDHRNSSTSVIHINGFIDRLTERTLLDEFKLTNTSYLTRQFRESDWCDLFLHHLRSAQAIFFVGYSLYDIDLQELLFADRSLREKTFFIQREGMSEDDLLLSDIGYFGTILPIGVDQFAQDSENVDPLAISSDKSLVLVGLEEMLIPTAKSASTAKDVFSLLLNGEVNSDLIVGQVIAGAEVEYVFARDGQKLVNENVKNYTVIGDLGNGKTTLLRCICAELLKQGKRCFWIKDEAYDCQDEIDAILNLHEPSVIVFDNYTKKLDLVAYANMKRRSDTTLVFSARTLLHKNAQEDLYYKKIRIDLSKTCEIDCNKLSSVELNHLSEYFAQYGLWGERSADPIRKKMQYLKGMCNSELHGVLLDLLSSPEIQTRFTALFSAFKGSKQAVTALVAGFSLNLLNVTSPTAHMIAALTGDGTVFSAAFRSNPILRQFFNHDRDVITPKSIALAEFCMKTFPDPPLLVDCLIDICKATRRKAAAEKKMGISRFYWDIYRDLASFSNVKRMLPDDGKRDLLIRFYEGLRTIDLERENPLFWLQYAMARMNQPQPGDLEQAATYLKTALSIARSKKGFTTVDIETQQARLFIEYAIHSATTADEAYSFFVQANSRLSKITKEEMYKTEPYRPMHNYSMWFTKFGDKFDDVQRRAIYDSFNYIIQNIKRLPPRIADEQVILTARRTLQEIMNKIELQMT